MTVRSRCLTMALCLLATLSVRPDLVAAQTGPQPACLNPAAPRIDIFYVNGVTTTLDEARVNAGKLEQEFLGRLARQIANWLSGPAESFATIPLNAAGVAVLIYVVLRGRQFDPWLRLVGASALAQHAVALFYTAAVARYHYLSWFLTMLVVMVWLQQLGVVWVQQRYPALAQQFTANPLSRRLASWLARLQKVSA